MQQIFAAYFIVIDRNYTGFVIMLLKFERK